MIISCMGHAKFVIELDNGLRIVTDPYDASCGYPVTANPADVVLLGSSMAANYYGSEIGQVFGGTGLRLTIPDGYFSEFDQVMDLLMRAHKPKRVIFAMDTNIFTRSPDGVTGAMPGYLYDADPVNDVKYLLNKDVLYYSLYALMCQRWGTGETLDHGFAWDGTQVEIPFPPDTVCIDLRYAREL